MIEKVVIKNTATYNEKTDKEKSALFCCYFGRLVLIFWNISILIFPLSINDNSAEIIYTKIEYK